MMPETRFTSFPALYVYYRVGISRSELGTDVKFHLSEQQASSNKALLNATTWIICNDVCSEKTPLDAAADLASRL